MVTRSLKTFEIHGFPKDIDSARELANNVKGWPPGIRGVDCRGPTCMVLSMNAGTKWDLTGTGPSPSMTRSTLWWSRLRAVGHLRRNWITSLRLSRIRRAQSACLSVFADEITKNMQIIAKEGRSVSPMRFNNTYCDKIQVISVEELMEGKRPMIPLSKVETFKRAEKASVVEDTQGKLGL